MELNQEEDYKELLSSLMELASSLGIEEEFRLRLILIFFRLIRDNWRIDNRFEVEELSEDQEWLKLREKYLMPNYEEIVEVFDLFEEEIEKQKMSIGRKV